MYRTHVGNLPVTIWRNVSSGFTDLHRVANLALLFHCSFTLIVSDLLALLTFELLEVVCLVFGEDLCIEIGHASISMSSSSSSESEGISSSSSTSLSRLMAGSRCFDFPRGVEGEECFESPIRLVLPTSLPPSCCFLEATDSSEEGDLDCLVLVFGAFSVTKRKRLVLKRVRRIVTTDVVLYVSGFFNVFGEIL